MTRFAAALLACCLPSVAWAVCPTTPSDCPGPTYKQVTVGGSPGTLSVANATTLSGTLGVAGTTTLSSTLGVTGAASFASTGTWTNSSGAGNTLALAAGSTGSTAATITSNSSGGININPGSGAVNLLVSATVPHIQLGKGNTFSWTGGAYSGAFSPLYSTSNHTGTGQLIGPVAPINYQVINSESLATGNGKYAAGWRFSMTTDSSSATGGRVGLDVQYNKTASTGTKSAGFGNPTFIAAQLFNTVSAGEGGTGTAAATAFGSVGAVNPQLIMASGATNMYEGSGGEVNVTWQTGSSGYKKTYWKLTGQSTDAVQGSGIDAMLLLADQAGASAHHRDLIHVGARDGQDPLDHTNGAILRWAISNAPADFAPAGLTGVDISLGPLSGNAFASRDFRVSAGAIYPFQGAITQISTGIQIDVPNYKITYSSIASGGTGNTQGDWYQDASSGVIVSADTVAAGVVTAATLQRTGYLSAAAADPLTVTNMNADHGGTFTIHPTSTLNNGLTLVSASNKIGFYGATPIVKATPVGACAGNTGCQALRDALGNLGLIDTGSITN